MEDIIDKIMTILVRGLISPVADVQVVGTARGNGTGNTEVQ